MSDSGWTGVQPLCEARADVGRFAKPLRDQFVATAIFPWVRERSGSVSVVGRVGLDYQPAQELLVSLAGSPVSGAILREPARVVTLSATDTSSIASELTLLPTSYDWEDRADLDSLITLLYQGGAVPFAESMLVVYAAEIADTTAGEPQYPRSESELIPALLAGAGRYQEAQRCLEDCRENDCHGDTRQLRRFARQLRRLIDSQGKLTIPASPPRWQLAENSLDPPQAEASVRFSAAYRRARAERDALDAVRSRRSTGNHGEVKELLERELDARGLSLSPTSLDHAVGVLIAERRPFGTARLLWNFVGDLRALSRSPTQQAANRLDTSQQGPVAQSFLPPDRAAFPLVGRTDRWTPIRLGPGGASTLERIWRSSPAGFGSTRELEAWLSYEHAPTRGETTLAVHVGRQRVGYVADEQSDCFQQVMAAAHERDEDPYARARLTRLTSSPQFLLEVPLPSISADKRRR